MFIAKNDMLINSLIGEDTVLRGEFDLNGVLRIDGTFDGNIDGNGKVLVGESGKVKSDIKARIVIIGGTVYGDIKASEMITILSTGKLIGNIETPRLIAEEGMIFDGKCNILEKEKHIITSEEAEINKAREALKSKPCEKELVKN